MAQAVGARKSFTGPMRLAIEIRPLDAVPDVAQRGPHREIDDTMPAQPPTWPVREQPQKIIVERHRPRPAGF